MAALWSRGAPPSALTAADNSTEKATKGGGRGLKPEGASLKELALFLQTPSVVIIGNIN